MYYNPNDRYRRRSALRAVRFFTSAFLIAVIGGGGFWIGRLQAEQRIHVLEAEKAALQQKDVAVQEEMTALRAEAQTANIRLEQLKAGYEEVLPEGPMQDLTVLLKKQLDEGIDAKRLEHVIRSARPPKNCSEPESRRFVVLTPAYQGPESKLAIASGIVEISGNGESARSDKGKSEAWFDPAKPVALRFVAKDGTVEKKEGVLPLYHSIVLEGREYRFTIAQGAQSFAKVTYDSCDYP